MNCRCYITEILLIWRKTPTNKPDSFYFIFLPNDKILDRSNLKAFAEDEINVTEKLKFVLGRAENIVEKGENAGYQHFLLSPQCFQKATSLGSLKVSH